MNIINSLINFKSTLKNTGRFDFEAYKLTGIHITQLLINEQKIIVSILLQNCIDDNFTFYLFILQSYINNLKKIDSYDIETISKILLNSISQVSDNEINLLKLLESLYPIDFSVICIDDRMTILSNYIIKLFSSEDLHYQQQKKYIDIIIYILSKENYYNYKDSINVYRYLGYLEKKFPQINKVINLKDIIIPETNILDTINIIKNSNNNVLESIYSYCQDNNLNIEELLNSRDKNNNNLLIFCSNYKSFTILYKSNLIHNTNLYEEYFSDYSYKPLYYFILSNFQEVEDKLKFINELGIVSIDNKELEELHNNTIKQIIKNNNNNNILYNNILSYLL